MQDGIHWKRAQVATQDNGEKYSKGDEYAECGKPVPEDAGDLNEPVCEQCSQEIEGDTPPQHEGTTTNTPRQPGGDNHV